MKTYVRHLPIIYIGYIIPVTQFIRQAENPHARNEMSIYERIKAEGHMAWHLK